MRNNKTSFFKLYLMSTGVKLLLSGSLSKISNSQHINSMPNKQTAGKCILSCKWYTWGRNIGYKHGGWISYCGRNTVEESKWVCFLWAVGGVTDKRDRNIEWTKAQRNSVRTCVSQNICMIIITRRFIIKCVIMILNIHLLIPYYVQGNMCVQ